MCWFICRWFVIGAIFPLFSFLLLIQVVWADSEDIFLFKNNCITLGDSHNLSVQAYYPDAKKPNQCRRDGRKTTLLMIVKSTDINSECNLYESSDAQVDMESEKDALFYTYFQPLAVCQSDLFETLSLSCPSFFNKKGCRPVAFWHDLDFLGLIAFIIKRHFRVEGEYFIKRLYFEPYDVWPLRLISYGQQGEVLEAFVVASGYGATVHITMSDQEVLNRVSSAVIEHKSLKELLADTPQSRCTMDSILKHVVQNLNYCKTEEYRRPSSRRCVIQ